MEVKMEMEVEVEVEEEEVNVPRFSESFNRFLSDLADHCGRDH